MGSSTITVRFPEGPRDVPAHAAERRGDVSSPFGLDHLSFLGFEPSPMPGWRFDETNQGWVANRESN